ncbi:DUF3093 domain-containing protein [Luteimicrobium subarcticum]|uniref:DUF3093 family protein n=1 Tax=Luteimicrobium subarcticum TaxID=620910 RepID=A0A2M8W451_9MICO|nr:DUF3093 domain-containing protein [Luteimicrobium subarcticum]PJI85706.1 Protein of unknown function (DUF3093) [Luteimicrobium subarcticum]
MQTSGPPPATAPAHATTYRERLAPGAGSLTAAVAFGLMFGVILWIVSPLWAVVVGGLAAVGSAVGLWAAAPVVAVVGDELAAGHAHIPATLLGTPETLDAAGLRAAFGPGSDARTFACLRPWVTRAVRCAVHDPQDPTPAWIVGTRHPERLGAALVAAGAGSHETGDAAAGDVPA